MWDNGIEGILQVDTDINVIGNRWSYIDEYIKGNGYLHIWTQGIIHMSTNCNFYSMRVAHSHS